MTDYNLAKQLKDAGFPQHSLCNNECMTEGDVGIDMCIPTLSELIEACEHPSFILFRNGFDSLFIWGASIDKPNIFYGKTPEEAVANLWLEINKKKPA